MAARLLPTHSQVHHNIPVCSLLSKVAGSYHCLSPPSQLLVCKLPTCTYASTPYGVQITAVYCTRMTAARPVALGMAHIATHPPSIKPSTHTFVMTASGSHGMSSNSVKALTTSRNAVGESEPHVWTAMQLCSAPTSADGGPLTKTLARMVILSCPSNQSVPRNTKQRPAKRSPFRHLITHRTSPGVDTRANLVPNRNKTKRSAGEPAPADGMARCWLAPE